MKKAYQETIGLHINYKNNSEKIIFHNASTAFVDRIRAPPAEI